MLGRLTMTEKTVWTESDRLLIIKAVMHIEAEIMDNPSKPIRSIGMKWDRILNLLPRAFLDKTPGGSYKCQNMFYDMVKLFHNRKRNRYKGPKRDMLTKPIQELLMRREDLLKGGPISMNYVKYSIEGDKSYVKHLTLGDRVLVIKAVMHVEEEIRNETSGRIRASSGKPIGKWERIASFLPPGLRHTPSGKMTDYRCRFVFFNTLRAYRAEKQGFKHSGSTQNILSDQIRELLKKREDGMDAVTSAAAETSAKSGSSNRVSTGQDLSEQRNDSHSTEVPSHFENNAEESSQSMERDNETYSLGCASTSLRGPRDYDKENQSPGFSPLRKCTTTSMAHASYHEHSHAIMDGSLRKIDQELSHLSSWLQSRSIPLAKAMLKERVKERTTSAKESKVNVNTEPFDDLIHESLSRRLDLQICSAFQNVRIRFAQELKNTVVELAEEVLRVEH